MTYDFRRSDAGRLIENDHNLEQLRRLFLDWDIIEGNGGEGTSKNDPGSWHALCHLVGAGIIAEHRSGTMVWLEIAWDSNSSSYYPAAVTREGSAVTTHNVMGYAEDWASKIKVLAFVEGASCGRISNTSVIDPGNFDTDDRRQDYHRFPLDFDGEGGKVWEHWCTTRNIKEPDSVGSQVLRAYLSLLCIGGTAFEAIVLRGRPYCGHPAQLQACHTAGLVKTNDLAWVDQPDPIPMVAQILFQYSEPLIAYAACQYLPLRESARQYFMFQRCIHLWQPIREKTRGQQ